MAELPFTLMHPKPDDIDENIIINENGSTSTNGQNKSQITASEKEHVANSNVVLTKDDAPNLIQLDG